LANKLQNYPSNKIFYSCNQTSEILKCQLTSASFQFRCIFPRYVLVTYSDLPCSSYDKCEDRAAKE
jgi:hypothetical protein